MKRVALACAAVLACSAAQQQSAKHALSVAGDVLCTVVAIGGVSFVGDIVGAAVGGDQGARAGTYIQLADKGATVLCRARSALDTHP